MTFPAVRLDEVRMIGLTAVGAVAEEAIASAKTAEHLLADGPLVVSDEPRALFDRVDAEWHALRLTADRTGIATVFKLTPSGFFGALPESSGSDSGLAPPVVAGAVFVGAASRGLAFQVGGAATGPAARLWEFAPGAGWRSVPLFGAEVGQVLTATYRYQDDTLYALVAAGARGRDEVRLVRILRTGNAAVLGAWPRAGRSDLRLSQGHRGELVISFSNPQRRAHAVLVLERGADQVWHPARLHSGAGALLQRAHLSTARLSLLIDDRGAPRVRQFDRVSLPAIGGYQACARWW